jgi:hypothetical protein
MNLALSRITASISLIGVAMAAFAVTSAAGQSSDVMVDHDRATEQRTNMPAREGPLQPVRTQALRSGCPGRVDIAACVNMNMLAPVGDGEIVGTAGSSPGTVKADPQDINVLGNK